jgi:hypothetical protein
MANTQVNVAMEHYKHKELERLSDKVKAMLLTNKQKYGKEKRSG